MLAAHTAVGMMVVLVVTVVVVVVVGGKGGGGASSTGSREPEIRTRYTEQYLDSPHRQIYNLIH